MTSGQQQLSTTGHRRAIGPVGTIARILVGLALLVAGIIAGGGWIAWWQLALGLVGLPVALTATQLARASFIPQPLTFADHLRYIPLLMTARDRLGHRVHNRLRDQ